MALDIVFLKSAVLPKDFPKGDRPEVALAGRSNAGKSSFLNSISKKPIAKVSQAPGKTRLLNFFDVEKSYRIVDMPGYGFAKRSGDEMREWTEMIESYLAGRANLAGLVLVMDIRRDWSEDEAMLANFLNERGVPVCVVATKADRLKPNEITKRLVELKKQIRHEAVFPVSNVQRKGCEEVEEYVFSSWINPLRGKKGT